MVSIATWNVNSVKARLEHLQTWLRERSPDIVLLQELKCEDDKFPRMEIEDLGYNLAIYGQKTYNGVAILSKFPLDDIRTGLPGNEEDEQARYIEAVASVNGGAIRVASIYVPNGQEVGSDKFAHKMRFFARLRAHAQSLMALDEITILGADYNVAPQALDVYDHAQLDGTVCYHPDERAHLRSLIHSGWYDAFRCFNPAEKQFSWWDYRAGAYPKNHGLRIDHLLLSPQATDCATSCIIDEEPRRWEKPSDHAPVIVTLATNH